MIRKIIKIDEKLCNGCGICADSCHEAAIEVFQGKARLIRDDYCDGLGDCLPVCPTSAITFEEREAAEYNEELVNARMKEAKGLSRGCSGTAEKALACGCPSGMEKKLHNNAASIAADVPSCLNQWPVQLKLVSPNSSFFQNANLLIAADCTAFSYGNFHQDFIRNNVVLIGCPKLDQTDYSEKISEIIQYNNISSITVVKMEVPCCIGIDAYTRDALDKSGKQLPIQTITISLDGKILK